MSDSSNDPAVRDAVIFEQIHAPIFVDLEVSSEESVLVMRREFSHSADALWDFLTQPEKLQVWSPIVPEQAFDKVGPMLSRENPDDDPVNADVVEIDAPNRLVHHWGDDVLVWTIAGTENGAVLELRQQLDDKEYVSSLAAGWQVCFGCLAAEDGTDRERVVGMRAMDYGWEELNEHYQRAFKA